jgi:3-dehydroquinate synthetase
MKEIFTYSVVKEQHTRLFLFSEETEQEFQNCVITEENSFTIIDTKVKTHFPNMRSIYSKAYPVNAGETCKSIDRVFELYTVFQALSNNIQTINVIGGGALIDLAGYALATSFQELKLRVIPTTPFSQLSGFYRRNFYIHFDRKINLLSVFGVPLEVWIIPFFLGSFSFEEVRKAHAVCFATALGFQEHFYFLVEKSLNLFVNNQGNWIVFYELLREHHFLLAKSSSEFRMLPGEALAELIQTATGFQMEYVDAFIKGLLLEAYISFKLGIIHESLLMSIQDTLAKAGLRDKQPPQYQVDLQTLFSLINEKGKIKMQILKGWGTSQETVVSAPIIDHILKEYYFGKSN